MKNWEFEDQKTMLSHLVGNSFGSDPRIRLEEIRREKEYHAQHFVSFLNIGAESTVVDLGSGSGLMAKYVAPKVRMLHCCDISQSFLRAAKLECRNEPNVAFHLIRPPHFDFAADGSIDAIYAQNVFIHLNLFQMHQYFREFSRVLGPQGRFCVDIASDECFSSGVPPIFREMSELYEVAPSNLPMLIQFCSPRAVAALASDFGFHVFGPSDQSAFGHRFFFSRIPVEN